MASNPLEHPVLRALVERSRRLGSDLHGSSSAKVQLTDPITGEPRTVLAVSGPGGLALLDLERLLRLQDARRGRDLGELLEYARFGPGGAIPIGTPLHAFAPARHVDHLQADALTTFAAAAEGREHVAGAFGGGLGWLDWQPSGLGLALGLRDLVAAEPELVGVVIGGHGLMSWGASSEAAEEIAEELLREAEAYLAAEARPKPFGEPRAGFGALPERERRRRAAGLAPRIRGLLGAERRVVGRFTDSPEVLEFLASESAERLAAHGTPPPLLLDLPPDTAAEEQLARLRELHTGGAAIVLLPGVGMWSFGVDARSARVGGELYAGSINVMRGAETISSYTPMPETIASEPRPAPRLAGRVAFVTGGASGIGLAVARRLHADGAAVVLADANREAAEHEAGDLGEGALALEVDVSDADAVARGVEAAVLRFGGLDIVVNNAGLPGPAPLFETEPEDYDRLYRVMARGSFLVSRAAARVLIDQGTGGDIVYVSSKNAVLAGPSNVAYGSIKAAQAHQVRLLAVELGPHQIRVNGVNPDAVVRGTGIFAGEWGRKRAETYGVPLEELGRYYADRTLLKREILPEHVAAAVAALVGGELDLTTGAFIPVDGGIPAAFPR
jgi:NAD(P)-dependent dehydrogenase (short-subunit alcohol dehydrogenase family)/rhamnose utilization protein RhaD (predicted bifunctional aldolase and dehydrogenase)